MKYGSKIKILIWLFFIFFNICLNVSLAADDNEKPDWVGGRPDGCTTITLGRNATDGGWVTTSHTCDSHRTRSWLDIMPQKTYPDGTQSPMLKRVEDNTREMPAYKYVSVGEIPQIGTTFGYINTA